MNTLIIGNYHHKNKEGLEMILNFLNFPYKFGNTNEIIKFDLILMPENSINTSNYPNKIFIFGPHFSVFPNYKLNSINNIYNNSIYIQPSNWARDVWINLGVEKIIPIKTFPFPVNTNKFIPINIGGTPKGRGIEDSREISMKSPTTCGTKSRPYKNEVILYYKRRNPKELKFIINFLKKKKINFKLFNYVNKYEESDYLNILQKSKYAIILDAHESQGFAIEEALSCNVPLLVYNVKYMSQEYNSKYNNIPATTIPYWDNRCGEYFYDLNDLENIFSKFINNLDNYKPREFILDKLSVKPCSKCFLNLINRDK